jgi:PPOX class probable F420-dependent enzyme
VKRIRRDPHVTIAVCSDRGKLHAPPVDARAALLPESEVARVKALMARKYRVNMLFIRPLRAVQSALHLGPSTGAEVVLRHHAGALTRHDRTGRRIRVAVCSIAA